MSASTRVPLHRVEPERLLHQFGEALRRRDFADQSAQDDQLRWWHNRALHGAYGIAEGLTVEEIDAGERVTVTCGVAFDVFGRDLILGECVSIDVPPVETDTLLVLRYDRPPIGCGERSGGYCLDQPYAHAGVALWLIRRRDFSLTDGVPVHCFTPEAEEKRVCADPWRRPVARALARPRIGHGVATAGDAGWDLWIEKVNQVEVILGIEVIVDTSAAHFTDVPCYFADVRLNDLGGQLSLLVAASFSNITDERKERFTLRLLCPWLIEWEDDRHVEACIQRSPALLELHTGGEDTCFAVLKVDDATVTRRVAKPGRRGEGISVSWIGIQHLAGPYGDDENGGEP